MPAKKIEADEKIEVMDVLAFVARVIRVRNANGRVTDKFCSLCTEARHLKIPCRHTDIWELVKANK